MDVRVNSPAQVIKSFSSWLPMLLVALLLYGVVFVGFTVWLLMQPLGMAPALAQQLGLIIGAVLLTGGFYLYVQWLLGSLAAYELSLNGQQLRVRGISGRGSIDNTLPLGELKKVHIGTRTHTMEKPSSGQRGANSKGAARMMFVLDDGHYFKLDYAANAFDNQSLYDFLSHLKRKGVDINISE